MLQQIYPQVQHDYTYELNKDLQFAAAHFIPHPDAGQCRNVHGHTYFVNITVAGDELDDSGFLVNFQALKKIVSYPFDHTLLNDHQMFSEKQPENFPSTEVVARKIYEMIQAYLDTLPNKPKCLQVFLRETPTSYVVYRPKRGK
ncbi:MULTISPECIES: 6-carboxytetrahydropterin synthase QueD [Bacillus]|jgi:6-pyruvoyltetrahydropterin/6-carboxytetrahydropterin synthase|uniref:6-carboxytetrahydropterin synthase QueD n=1 Tax=Bacillus TaxID=1386 RepID=UPI00065E7E78|nr:6-carboxytetrahydropterin synthase QueD [Bacillus smithii]AKP46586.1 Queuosine biosynthesis QueDPTPS-I [Bacillus smithii]MED4883186.1 6-carboxytetrahydropterin synthase QueD [Bacillus smithii]MED4926510.1 6-carboxytetrahydropterin synthase QueD [Bacillus smithii]